MIVIKQINKDDYNCIIQIHNESFENFFLTSLGNHFLKLYYLSVAKSPNGILLGAFNDDKLIGFCAATFKSKNFYFSIIQDNLLHFIAIGFYLFFTRPKSLIRLLKNMTKKSEKFEDNGYYAELLSIAVDSNAQNLGVGKKMLYELEGLVIKKGMTQISLTTDFYNNNKAIHFYFSYGYKIYYEFEAYPNRKMYRLIKNIY